MKLFVLLHPPNGFRNRLGNKPIRIIARFVRSTRSARKSKRKKYYQFAVEKNKTQRASRTSPVYAIVFVFASYVLYLASQQIRYVRHANNKVSGLSRNVRADEIRFFHHRQPGSVQSESKIFPDSCVFGPETAFVIRSPQSSCFLFDVMLRAMDRFRFANITILLLSDVASRLKNVQINQTKSPPNSSRYVRYVRVHFSEIISPVYNNLTKFTEFSVRT